MKDSPSSDVALKLLEKAIESAAHLLPAQGPITVFIHHNPLHAVEDMPFDRALAKSAELFGLETYLPESSYRDALATGRIRADDLYAVLEDDLRLRAIDGIARLVSRLDLRLAMLQYPLLTGPAEELLWFVAMTDALKRIRPAASAATKQKLIAETRRWVMRDLRGGGLATQRSGATARPAWVAELFEQFAESEIESWDDDTWEAVTLEALWRVCGDGVREVPQFAPPPRPLIRHCDLLNAVTETDIEFPVHSILIRFCAAFVDQGLAHWPLPGRDKGFFHAFASLYRSRGGSPEPWLRQMRAELGRLEDMGQSALESVLESLVILGVPEIEWNEFIAQTFLALRGWSGIIHHIETRGDRVAQPIPPGSLTGLLAVRLLLERFALVQAAKDSLGYTGPLRSLRAVLRRRLPPSPGPSPEERAFLVFQLAQVLGWSPDRLYRRTTDQWSELVREIEEFNGIERRRLLHLAYEKRLRDQALDALALHPSRPVARPPRLQIITCLDEREESFRRHLEEGIPGCETFGAAGFFGIAMYYRGAADAHFVPLCPIAIQPRHYVQERAEESLEETERRRQARRVLGLTSHNIHVGTRGILAGALAAAFGASVAMPLVLRTLSPRLAARIRGRVARWLHGSPRTGLHLERKTTDPPTDSRLLGYTLGEMTTIADRQLREIGLTRDFARLVLIVGHGSHSMNNPHESAHDCGACGGSAGGANARALAQILNDSRVRVRLSQRGLSIPGDTRFLGALHNTCNEYVKVFDEEQLPGTHRDDLEYARRALKLALERNAHERARRFQSASLTLAFDDAVEHMDNRAEDLAQVRPEWGHATNSICVVGRRDRTRGLFLDRRAFLVSYDPTQDDVENTILAQILAAAVPVCAGINLEYYFCRVSPAGWGCGTKLPHNITALIGVMDGAASDLRTGLPWQMVEIHEPVRLLMVIETTARAMLQLMARHPAIERLVRNSWVQLAVLDPNSSRCELFECGGFFPYRPQADRLPVATQSLDWYRGWRDYLEFAEIGSTGKDLLL
jgi:uncharacterized protein YbcC (UPF0753/DUF2309 family)